MIRIYTQSEKGISRTVGMEDQPDSLGAVFWIDLLTPSAEELAYAEKLCAIEMPTKDEMREIEATSRLYCEDGGRFMTTTVLSRVETDEPIIAEITFILKGRQLITIRHTDSYSFRVFSHQLLRTQDTNRDLVFIGLLETLVDRQADVLERFGTDLDALSKKVFGTHHTRRKGRREDPDTDDLRDALEELGRVGDLITRQRDALVNLLRMITFAGNEDSCMSAHDSLYVPLRPVSRDVNSLAEYASFLSNKINFMLDAVLGLINIEQNDIFKVFTIMSVVFLPPTLIASIFGMNFKYIPFLDTEWGFWFSIVLMGLAGILPLIIFKIKRYI
ncbi:MAG: magnesium transporter CorA family protein [Akkermansia sp.]|nr:magnesium transporter CorA family protein [Akkermansia sp.]MBR1978372.1 magnesium transporter CorA family protein [Akkermansia sp.]